MVTDALLTSHRRRLPAIDVAVDVGFAVLLIVCAARYFSRHAFDTVGTVVLVLAIGTGLSYAVAVIGRRRGDARPPVGLDAVGTRQGIGLLVATALWLPLVVLAPSFGWCGFALFFAVYRVIRGRLALLISATIVLAVSAGLFLMSNGDDLGLVFGPLVGGLVLAYAYSALDRVLGEQRMLIAELVDTREQLARSERDAGALAERGRVASELHDTVVQRTASALLLLESDDLREGTTSPGVREAAEALRESLVETRQLLHGLADAPLQGSASLAAALAELAGAAQAEFAIVGVERGVSPPIAHALRRVVQEALVNVRKHARAATTRVTLTYFADEVGVDIADDGIGFEVDERTADAAEAARSGFGIRAMTWRIAELGGLLTVESESGRGTIIAAIVPDLRDGERAS